MASIHFVMVIATMFGPFMMLNSDPGEQRFEMEPQDQTAVVGSRVTLPCRVIDNTGTIRWTKDGDFCLDTHQSRFDRYSIASNKIGDCFLQIYPATLEDDAQYQCQVLADPQAGQPGLRSQVANVSMLVPPDPPKILQGDYMVATEGDKIELTCISHGGKPAAEITWINDLGNFLTDGIEYIVEDLPDGKRFTAKSTLKLTARKEHNNTTFICQAQNSAEITHRSAKLKLEVKYAPKETVNVFLAVTAAVIIILIILISIMALRIKRGGKKPPLENDANTDRTSNNISDLATDVSEESTTPSTVITYISIPGSITEPLERENPAYVRVGLLC